MVTISLTDTDLVLKVLGLDVLWALKSELTIPLEHIESVRLDAEIVKGWLHGFRFPGSNIPGVLTTGTFIQDGEKIFWDVHTPELAVVISLRDETYKELVVEVENPKLELEKIASRLQLRDYPVG